jgi:hypothetical protein
MASNVLFVNPKWRRTEVQDALTSKTQRYKYHNSLKFQIDKQTTERDKF